MPTDLADPPVTNGDPAARSSLPNDSAVGLYRPVRPDLGVARRLRKLAGIREDILDWVPEERSRYTRLGAIVLNTGLLAGLSLVVALHSVAGGAWWMLLPFGALWAYLIMTFDGWLISSTHGVQHVSKLRLFLPRIIISLLLGAAIAEPLVLWVFQPSIHNNIDDHRKKVVEDYEGVLRRCNPPTGEPTGTPDCAGYLVNIPNSPAAIQAELGDTTRLSKDTQETLGKLDGKHAELEQLARDECAGKSGPGLTGDRGEGGECLRNRQKADQFRTDNQLDKQHADLVALNAKVTALNGQLSTARASSETEISRAITAKVDAKRANLDDRGLLDEIDALDRLSAESTAVSVAGWVLRLLLIAIDCMPVFSKLMGGTTCYDILVSRQLESAKRLHTKHVSLYERRDSVDLDILAQRTEQKLRTKTGDMDNEERMGRAKRKQELTAQIDHLAEQLERR
ncbi:DUF4407 domain-containing protein [Amycolatopsis azurea]|uniref:DUF4407 domain-containing protein n=1 Tax=Amycolatopsis azurea DSM 43854 TaxID=1238180 RepID=M2QC47_9PSEU|nr:DUF4407 domain-containing protein [Amycolatopsis azurea]EMD24316.1 hypothetical protein C791_5931 [Amycolatopsis azurea DSM 43854]OOC07094.1 hypothetical protein B0293_08460 [Amycolatopsis azurea DSM 43854]